MKHTIPASLPRALAVIALAGLASSQTHEPRVPSALPSLPDLKTPCPALEKPAAPAGALEAPSALADARGGLRERLVAAPSFDRVLHDADAQGVLWSRGETWKARFDPAGVTYLPFLGSRAAGNHPVTLRLAGATLGGEVLAYDLGAAPRRAGDAVLYARGAFVERYDLSLASVEQSFVFESLSARGEIAIEVEIDTALAVAVREQGLELAGELGGVRASGAVAFDADGSRIELAARRTSNGYALVVPAHFVAEARLPLVVDPVLTTFAIETAAAHAKDPDVAYDATTGRYLVVWEQEFSQSDHDVYGRFFDSNGVAIAGANVAFDLSSANWTAPKVANNAAADQFLVVADVAPGVLGTIRGRTCAAATGAVGADFQIDGGELGGKGQPDVGGDPFGLSPSYYCVVWRRHLTLDDADVHARLVKPDGTLHGPGTITLDNTSSTLDEHPRISKANGTNSSVTQEWNIVWGRRFSAVDHDVHGAQIHWDGTVTTPPFAIDTSAHDDYYPVASTGLLSLFQPRRYLVVWERVYAAESHADLFGEVLEGSTTIDTADLSALQADPAGTMQILPDVDCAGTNFVVTWEDELAPASFAFGVKASTFALIGSDLAVAEARVPLSSQSGSEYAPALTGRHLPGETDKRFFVAWQEGFSNGDLAGAIFEATSFTSFCLPGVDGVPSCPCANPPAELGRGCDNSSLTGGARLTASGNPSLGNDTVVLVASDEKPTATSVFLQGTTSTAVVFGQGVRCAGGTLKRLYVKPAVGGTVSAPAGPDPSVSARAIALGDLLLSGSTRYYSVYYRDPGVPVGCPASSTFNTTPTIQAIWAP